MGMMQEFREFAIKGNVMDLAVGVRGVGRIALGVDGPRGRGGRRCRMAHGGGGADPGPVRTG